MLQLRIYSRTYGYTTRYWVHEKSFGDSGNYYNGAIAGCGYKRLEGLCVNVYKWY